MKIRTLFSLLLIYSLCIIGNAFGQVIPSFTTPDTVCVNTPVHIDNTSTNASSYYWNFCVADLNTPPTAVNLGNIGSTFSSPTFMDYAFSNNNYYGFVTNYAGGNLVRLDFGNSLLNTPTAVNLGNFAGALSPANVLTEGIQVVFNEGRWYAIIVGNANTSGAQPRIFKVDFGANINNPTPVITDWGNIGNLAQPIDLHMFQDAGNWYGFTTNSENNTITRFNFTNSFNNTPTALNLGNVGGLSYPTGIYAINDNSSWRVFVVNGGNNSTTNGAWSLSRLDFGSSLLSTPTGVNLGNLGNTLAHPRDITIMKSCGQIVGFATNGNPAYNDIVKLDFNNNLLSTPSAVSLGNFGGNLNFPHSISKLFRVKDELYSFVTNASGAGNSVVRLRFAGCSNASIASSTVQHPPDIVYNLPGTYNINVSVDDGLATQGSFCRQVVVIPKMQHMPIQTKTSCNNATVKIGTGIKNAAYLWNNGATTDSISVTNPDLYWVKSSRFGCENIDSFVLAAEGISIKTNNDTSICVGKSIQLNTTGGGPTYSWTPATGLSNTSVANPVATPLVSTQYIVTATGVAGCIAKDTVVITIAAPATCAIVNVIPAFTAPDTICVNTPLKITNTSTGASTYFWNFCVAGINSTPVATNLGNPGGTLSQPVFSDIVEDNGNYYAFVVDFLNYGIVRLDFGNSMLNSPTAVNLGNPSGALNSIYGKEGIQVIKNEGKWYAIIVGGNPVGNGSAIKIVKIEFGTNIANNTPTGTDWGNIGSMYEPIDLYMFQESGNWYGFTTNATTSTITRFNFGSSFNNTPTAINLGNIGGLNYPTGIYALNDNGSWKVFVTNGNNSTLTRLDFGTSLLNIPTGINLGNPGGVLSQPRDFTILRLCGEIAGFAVNGTAGDLVKFDFHNDVLSVPTGTSLGNTGSFAFPHSISKFFRVNNDLYTLVTNVNNNTITRLQFAGCSSTTASILSSALQNPPGVSYSQPGTYNINLTVDEGLPTQNSFCKQVVVMPALVHTPLRKIISCNTDSVKIGIAIKQPPYKWSNGAVTDSFFVKTSGTYVVQTVRFGCSNTDSVTVTLEKIAVKTNNDTVICSGKTVQLYSGGTGVQYSWSPATSLSNPAIANPLATPTSSTQYIVTSTGNSGCIANDTVLISVNQSPVITRTNDTTICHDQNLQLNVTGGNSYVWANSATLSNTGIANPIASPVVNTTYYFTVSNNNCSNADSIKVMVKPKPVFSISPTVPACLGVPAQLKATGGNSYSWQPGDGLNNSSIANPLAIPKTSTVYTVKIIENTCKDSASLFTSVTVLPLPTVQARSSNDVDCTMPTAQLNVSGAIKYLWSPGTSLNDSSISNPLSTPSNSTLYIVKGSDLNGCSNYDSVLIKVTHVGDLLVNMPNAFTPNNDGKNDCFGLGRYGGLLQKVQFSIYNRWGQRVFYTSNPTDCWDGKFKGKIADAGGYVYILNANTFCGVIFKKGIVMLIR